MERKKLFSFKKTITLLEHMSCHMTYRKESHWLKKMCSETIRNGSEKSWIEFNFFLNRFDQFCSAHVNRSRAKGILREQ